MSPAMNWHDYDLLILLNGAVKALTWGAGALLAGWRKRGMLSAGFALACLIVSVRAFTDAALPHSAHTSLLAYAATPCAGLIVASFVGRQPCGVPRPARWTL